MAEEEPVSLASIAKSQRIPAKEFEKQYKNHLSGFKKWEQKEHADKWMVFPKNIGQRLSIDEVAISNGELYTVLTNKAAHGKKNAIIATVQGTKASDVSAVLAKIPLEARKAVREVTLDMSGAMDAIVRKSFPKACRVTDRFHVQQLVSEALQEVRISIRRDALKEENEEIKKARKEKRFYYPKIFKNGDTKRQLLARSRHLLFQSKNKWNEQQKERAGILFEEYPELKKAYDISMLFRKFYEHSKNIFEAKKKLNDWYKKIEDEKMECFLTAAESIRLHETTVLNYFTNRSTNASAESFNAKLKGFRALVRGVRDKKFFLFRIAKIYG